MIDEATPAKTVSAYVTIFDLLTNKGLQRGKQIRVMKRFEIEASELEVSWGRKESEVDIAATENS